jgi:hypothetical protein
MARTFVFSLSDCRMESKLETTTHFFSSVGLDPLIVAMELHPKSLTFLAVPRMRIFMAFFLFFFFLRGLIAGFISRDCNTLLKTNTGENEKLFF